MNPPPVRDGPDAADLAEATITDLERATGLGKELLRKWEQRYGFPHPVRTVRGQRRYPQAQVERLRLVARLIEGGWRPGQLLRLPEPELQALARNAPSRRAAPVGTAAMAGATAFGAATAPHPAAACAPAAHEAVIAHWLHCVASDAPDALRAALHSALAQLGLERLACELVPGFLSSLGEAWQTGRVEVYQEHWASHLLDDMLRAALYQHLSSARPAGPPRVLLCTPPGEAHTLGLLLAQCVLACQGADTVRLGAQLAPRDLGLAVRGLRPDIVAIGVGPHLPAGDVQRNLRELQAALPDGAALWLGGTHPALDALAADLSALRLASLLALPQAVAAWRQAHQPTR